MINNTKTQEKKKYLYASQEVMDILFANGFVEITKQIDPEQIAKNEGFTPGDTKQWFRMSGSREPLINFDYINIHVYPDDSSIKSGAFSRDLLRCVIAFAKLPPTTRREFFQNSIRGIGDLPAILEDMKKEYSVFKKARHHKFKAAWDSVIMTP